MGAGAAGKRRWPGCTALAVLLKDDYMFVANAGKSDDRHHLHQHLKICKYACLLLNDLLD